MAKKPTLADLLAQPTAEESQKAKDAITKQRIQLLVSETPFFAFLSLNLLLKERVECKTMATNGIYLYYNPKWVLSIKEKELVAVICHEAMHCALGHIWREGPRKHEKWNYACDYVINGILDHNGFTLPKEGLLDHAFDNLASEEVYNKIPDPEEDGGAGFGGGGLIDNHDYWGDKDGQDGDGQGQGKLENGTGVWEERLSRAAVAAKLQGKLPADIEALVDEVLQPKLPWREILRNFVHDSNKTEYRMSPPSKRFLHIPLIMPSMKGEFIEIGFFRDTSGSMSDNAMKVITGEVLGIADTFESFRLHVWDCDAKVQSYQMAETYEDVKDAVVKVKGRGGTDFRPVFKDIEERDLDISCLIVMTDTMGTFPEHPPAYPVLWVVDSPERTVPFGDMLVMDMEEING